MRMIRSRGSLLFIAAAIVAAPTVAGVFAQQGAGSHMGPEVAKQLPPPAPDKAGTRFAKVIGWPKGTTPTAAEGFTVNEFAADLKDPRWLYVLPNGDVLVAESRGEPSRSPNRVTLLRDTDKDGRADTRSVLISNVRQPFGMLLRDDGLYVAATDALMRYPYKPGETTIAARGTKLLDLPAGGYNNHWTRNVIESGDKSKLFISVGSGTNVDEEHVDVKDPRRAAVLEVNPDGSNMRVFASGLRNPVGIAIQPESRALWAVVNERDMLGDELVPDYLTEVKDGAFYGWPYSYFGSHVDPRKEGERPDLVAKAVIPDYSLGSHVAPLGLMFYTADALPARYKSGAFVGLHGSWNKTQFAGYKVIFVPFQGGRPSGPPEDVLTGFIKDPGGNEVYGRPVGLATLADGSILVADDGGNVVWRIAAAK
jgi:glucose/arabinose dehydrogenase